MRKDEMKDRRIGLADANNFFVSCERKYDESLIGRPVVVLSGNDGCIISRSNEVKHMGVKMGVPYYQVEKILKYNGVAIRSANHRMYQKISSEVMRKINNYTDCMEYYSIDESFFNIGIPTVPDPVAYCRQIREDVWRSCKIPISIAIAPTKTLAKLGSEIAKKSAEAQGVFWMDSLKYKNFAFMEQINCRDVWNIGPRMANSLSLLGIRNAAQFVAKDDLWIKEKYGRPGLMTAWELRGFPVSIIADKRKPPQSIMVSRSFGETVTKFNDVKDALLTFTVAAAAQLRRAQLTAGRITVYLTTNRFAEDFYSNSKEHIYRDPASLDADFIHVAVSLLKDIFIEGREYKKCGVMLSDFVNVSLGRQTSLFAAENDARRKAAMDAIDKINNECGTPALKPAVLCETPEEEKKWLSKSSYRTEATEKVIGKIKNTAPDGLRFQSKVDDYA